MDKSISATKFIEDAHEHQVGKVCCRCKKLKPRSEFWNKTSSTDGLGYHCISCDKEEKADVCPFKRWFIRKRANAKQRGTEFTIEPDDIPGVKIEKYSGIGSYRNIPYSSWIGTEYPKICSKWNIKIFWGKDYANGWSTYNSPSLDRIDPTKGYIPGNVRLVCNSCNSAKSNCPPDEWDIIEKKIARNILFGEVGR
jgi:hypothetical protein